MLPSYQGIRTPTRISADLVSLLNALPGATPKTVPPTLLVEAYFQLVEGGHEDEAACVLAHLVTEKNGYIDIVRHEARKWKDSGHAGFGEDDLVQETLERIIEGLRRGQQSALKWRSFCYARFKDAKGARDLNGYRGGRAKVEKQIQRLVSQDPPSDGTREEAEPISAAPTPRTRQLLLEPEFLSMFSGPDLRKDVEDEDLEVWGGRVIERILCRLEHNDADAAYVAREVFCADPRPLTGPPDESGFQSVAEARGWADHRAKHLKKKARAFFALELNSHINGAVLGAGAQIERAWLRTWFNKHEIGRGQDLTTRGA